MDETYLLACLRYVELNPVRAGLVRRPGDWRWSSAKAHLAGQDDGLVKVGPMLDRIPDWAAFLKGGIDDEALGSDGWLKKMEAKLARPLRPKKAGRPRKTLTDSGN